MIRSANDSAWVIFRHFRHFHVNAEKSLVMKKLVHSRPPIRPCDSPQKFWKLVCYVEISLVHKA